MSGLYANTGVDLDLILFTGSGAQTTEIYDDTGLDIGLKYSSGDTGYALGFQVHDGRDIGRILGGEVAEIWRTGCLTINKDRSVVEEAGWEAIKNFQKDKAAWKRITTTAETDILWGIQGFWNRYTVMAFHVAASEADSEIEVSFKGPIGQTTGGAWLSEIRSPTPYTKNFLVVGQNTDTDSEAGQGHRAYLKIVLKMAKVPSRAYSLTLAV